MRGADCVVYLENFFAFGRSIGFNIFLPVARVRALAFHWENAEEEGPRVLYARGGC